MPPLGGQGGIRGKALQIFEAMPLALQSSALYAPCPLRGHQGQGQGRTLQGQALYTKL